MSQIVSQEAMRRYGPRLRAARESSGLSLAQVARLSLTPSLTIDYIETGYSVIATTEQIETLMRIYRCTIEEMEAEPITMTDEEAIQALRDGRLTEDEFMRWIRIDRIDWMHQTRRDH